MSKVIPEPSEEGLHFQRSKILCGFVSIGFCVLLKSEKIIDNKAIGLICVLIFLYGGITYADELWSEFATFINYSKDCRYAIRAEFYDLYEDSVASTQKNSIVHVKDYATHKYEVIKNMTDVSHMYCFTSDSIVTYNREDSSGRYFILDRFWEQDRLDTLVSYTDSCPENEWLTDCVFFDFRLRDSVLVYFDSLGCVVRKLKNDNTSSVVRFIDNGRYCTFTHNYDGVLIELQKSMSDSVYESDLAVYNIARDSFYILFESPGWEEFPVQLSPKSLVFYRKADYAINSLNLYMWSEKSGEVRVTDLAYPYYVAEYKIFEDSVVYGVKSDEKPRPQYSEYRTIHMNTK